MHKTFSEQCQSFFISEISKDSQLLSLFMDCQPHGTVLQIPPQPSKDLCPQDDYYFQGFWSEEQPNKQTNKTMRKHKQIINKKDRLKKKKRTKIYIEMLQNRVLELQGENQKLIKLNKTNKQYIHKLNQSQHHINGYFIGRQQVFEQLEKMNSQTSLEKQKIVDEVISLRMRQGAYGKDRIKAINYYFKQMIEMLLPQIQKYLLKITLQKSDFFDTDYISTGRIKNQSQGWRQQLFQSLESDHQSNKLRNFLNQNQNKLQNIVLNFKQTINKFYNLKCELIKHSRKIQQAFDGCHKHMSIKLISKTLCYIDRYRFEKGISLEHTLSQIFDKVHQQSYNYNPDNPFETVY